MAESLYSIFLCNVAIMYYTIFLHFVSRYIRTSNAIQSNPHQQFTQLGTYLQLKTLACTENMYIIFSRITLKGIDAFRRIKKNTLIVQNITGGIIYERLNF